MLLFEHNYDFKVAPYVWSIYQVVRGGPFLGFIGLASGPTGANGDDPCTGNSCFLH